MITAYFYNIYFHHANKYLCDLFGVVILKNFEKKTSAKNIIRLQEMKHLKFKYTQSNIMEKQIFSFLLIRMLNIWWHEWKKNDKAKRENPNIAAKFR